MSNFSPGFRRIPHVQLHAELGVALVLKIMLITSKKVLLWSYWYSSDCCVHKALFHEQQADLLCQYKMMWQSEDPLIRETLSLILQERTGRLNCKYGDNYLDSGERAQASPLASIRLLEASVHKSRGLAKWYLSLSFDLLEWRRTLAIKSNPTCHIVT